MAILEALDLVVTVDTKSAIGGCDGSAVVADAAFRPGLALAARPLRQHVMPDRASVPPTGTTPVGPGGGGDRP